MAEYRSQADLGKSPRGAGIKGYLTPRGHRVLAALDAADLRRHQHGPVGRVGRRGPAGAGPAHVGGAGCGQW